MVRTEPPLKSGEVELQPGDRVVAVNGVELTEAGLSARQVRNIFSDGPVGEIVRIRVLRSASTSGPSK